MVTAYVLSGGGSLGAVQVGMLQALAARGVEPDLLIGTSAGALNAAYIAGHGTGPAALDDLKGGTRLSHPERFLSLHGHHFNFHTCHGGGAA
jgi:NTE family protein